MFRGQGAQEELFFDPSTLEYEDSAFSLFAVKG